jgi:threonine dehydrogenase-like Zn-dependent dehydrogenase
VKTTALRLYGKNDLRLETFDLPPIGEREILADIVSDSVCMSTYKAAIQGTDHKRVPKDIAERPVIVGHEFCGRILETGRDVDGSFRTGMKYAIQPALNAPGRELEAPGYSYRYIGGDATRIVIPAEVMELGCLLPYEGEGYFKASLAEPVSCVIGAFKSSYHFKQGEYVHRMGIVEGGACAMLAAAGPMGMLAIDFAVHGPRRPRLLVVTDIDQARLDRASRYFTVADARRRGVDLHYVNTKGPEGAAALAGLAQGKGYDDVFVFAPVTPVVEQGAKLLAFNGCLNFFAGPSDRSFGASVNFYDIHYSGHHYVGSSGGNTEDMKDALRLMSEGALNPSVLITHVGGLDAAAGTIKDLPRIPGGKKLIYTQISMPLVALEEFEELGKRDPVFAELARITAANDGLWSVKAEEYLLAHAKPIGGR